MNKVVNYESIFERYGGIMRTCELTREGISYQTLQKLIGPVYEAILQENEFWGMWSSKENMWKR